MPKKIFYHYHRTDDMLPINYTATTKRIAIRDIDESHLHAVYFVALVQIFSIYKYLGLRIRKNFGN